MTELAALNVRITGDAGDLRAAVNVAEAELAGLAKTATATQARMGAMGGALGGLAQRMSSARGQIQNVSFQLQDMAVQLAAGTNASIVFAQQGSQIASAFGPMGAVLGAVLAVTPFLAMAFFDTTEKASGLAGAIKDLDDATQAYLVTAAALKLGVDEEEVALVQEINRLMDELNKLNAQWQATDSLGARQRIAEETRELKAQLAPLQQKLEAYRAARDEAKRLTEETKRTEEAAIKAATATSGIGTAASGAIGAVKSLGSAMWDVANAAMARINAENKLAAMKTEFSPAGQAMAQFGGRGAVSDRPVTLGDGTELPVDGQGFGGVGSGTGGGAAESPILAELQALQEGLMSAEQMQMESYQRQQETLQQALDQRLITQEEYQRLMQQAQATHDFAMSQSVNKGVSDTLSALGNLFQGSKKIGAAVALANSWLAFTEVLKDPAYVGRPWARIAAAGNALAAGLNAVRNIKSASPGASGGGGAGASMGAQAAPPQQNVQTLNFSIQNDPFGLGQNIIRQIASQLNEAQRNGSTLIRATVS